jgi:hypothetical protein
MAHSPAMSFLVAILYVQLASGQTRKPMPAAS